MKDQRLGMCSGMGMAIADMIGTGYFLSTGLWLKIWIPKGCG